MANRQITIPQLIARSPSAVQRRSSGSVKVAFLDRERAITELVDAAHRLLARDDRVLAVGLFGSLARRQALPSSDGDVLIVLKEHPLPRWFDRITEYADRFAGTSLPVEVFPYTEDELKRMCAQGSGFLRSILRDLVPLGGAPWVWEMLKQGLTGLHMSDFGRETERNQTHD